MIPSLAGQSTIGAVGVNTACGREERALVAVRVSTGQLPIHADLSSSLFLYSALQYVERNGGRRLRQ